MVNTEWRCGNDADALTSDLGAVAVRAAEHVTSPALAQPWDGGELIHQARGHQHGASLEGLSRRRGEGEQVIRVPGSNRHHVGGADLATEALHFGASLHQ